MDREENHNRGNFTRNTNKEKDEAIAKKMFIGGLFLLPWLWAVNVFYYRKQFMDKTIDPQVTKWTRRSFAGFLLYTSIFLSWAIVFQLQWRNNGWESLLLSVPKRDIDRDW